MESSFTSDHHAKAHCFFKIIISEISSESKLMIPEKFARKYGEELGRHVQLKAPGSVAWRVDVQRKKGKIWLRKGWPEFATFYSLCFGHSIFFVYQGNCNFKVVIFDPSATEIDYPLQPEKRTRGHSGDCLMQKWQKGKFAKASSDMEIISSSEDEESADFKIPSNANGNRHSTSRMKKPIKLEVDLNKPMQQHDNVRAKGGGRSASKEECNKALASANAFKSSYPFFIKVMQPSFVGKTNGWNARKADLKTYMRDNVEVLILRLGGQTWLIKCRIQSGRVKMGCGWQQFAEDNALAVGDVCVFEMVKPSKKLLEVAIYRAAAV
ncbi:hypothetical protein POM88_000593 [Heracleum sosnowskyi]|uniref:TF-B3 domain-containing protein n=1 Tax=Heracleum sosnowskyi TaxID=360622 RepID=A0AAD8JBU5_9APIA|nr:hypothetical protein POM88_000593 [Heracleum sosnowskyi]